MTEPCKLVERAMRRPNATWKRNSIKQRAIASVKVFAVDVALHTRMVLQTRDSAYLDLMETSCMLSTDLKGLLQTV